MWSQLQQLLCRAARDRSRNAFSGTDTQPRRRWDKCIVMSCRPMNWKIMHYRNKLTQRSNQCRCLLWSKVYFVFVVSYLFMAQSLLPSCRWQICAAKACQNCPNSTSLQRCRWWSIFFRLAVVASEICEISRFQEFLEFKVIQGHRSWCQSKAHMYFDISH